MIYEVCVTCDGQRYETVIEARDMDQAIASVCSAYGECEISSIATHLHYGSKPS